VYLRDSGNQAIKTLLGLLRHHFDLYTRGNLSRSILIYFFTLYFIVSFTHQGFQGYDFVAPPFYFIILQISFVLFAIRLLPLTIQRPVDVFQIFTALFLTIPTLVTSFTNSERVSNFESFGSTFSVLLNQLILYVLGHIFSESTSEPRFILKKSKYDISLILILVVSLLLTAYIFSTFKINKYFGLDQVYVRRSEFMEFVSKPEGVILGYTFGILGGLLVPLILIWALHRKSYLLIVYSLILAVIVYLGAAQKWVFGTMALVLILFIIHKPTSSRIQSARVFNVVSIMVWILIALDSLFKGFRIVDLGVRRFLLDPSVMLQYYVAFTKDYPFRLWQDLTPVKWIFGSTPISNPPANVLGERYFYIPEKLFLPNTSRMNGTAGAISDSIAQAGILGLILTTFLLFIFFHLLGRICVHKNSWLVFSISALSTYVITEGTFHTSIFSKGLFLVPLMLILQPRQTNNSIEKEGRDESE
jgi:hypothetical protein